MRGIQSRGRDAEPPWDGQADCPGDSGLSFVVFFPQALLQKTSLTPRLLFFVPWLPSPSSWRGSSLICVRKSKQSTSLLRSWCALSQKLTQDILESWPREGKQGPQQTTQKSFLWRALLRFSVQQEGLKSTAMSQHRLGKDKRWQTLPVASATE